MKSTLNKTLKSLLRHSLVTQFKSDMLSSVQINIVGI